MFQLPTLKSTLELNRVCKCRQHYRDDDDDGGTSRSKLWTEVPVGVNTRGIRARDREVCLSSSCISTGFLGTRWKGNCLELEHGGSVAERHRRWTTRPSCSRESG